MTFDEWAAKVRKEVVSETPFDAMYGESLYDAQDHHRDKVNAEVARQIAEKVKEACAQKCDALHIKDETGYGIANDCAYDIRTMNLDEIGREG